MPSPLGDGLTEAALCELEVAGLPKLLRGFATQWPCYSLWRGESGLRQLSELAGGAYVQVMSSQSDVFRGDTLSQKPLMVHFSDVLGAAADEVKATKASDLKQADVPRSNSQVYLAQTEILSRNGQAAPLAALLPHVQIPFPLTKRPLEHVNFWMSTGGASSSLHYDVYHNLLCVVTGRKTVHMASPAATPLLRPLAVWGDSCNHSHADLGDVMRCEPAAARRAHASTFDLEAGDALFIPEGWWHQIGSAGVTMAVNFWWRAPGPACHPGGVLDAYHLRRLANSLTEAEKARLLDAVEPLSRPGMPEADAVPSAPGTCVQQGSSSNLSLLPGEVFALQVIASAVTEGLSPADGTCREGGTGQGRARKRKAGGGSDMEVGSAVGLDHPITRVLAGLGLAQRQRVLLHMTRHLPRTLQLLLGSALPPAAAELLLAGFEGFSADPTAHGLHMRVDAFFGELYGVMDDPHLTLASLVAKKEAFGYYACRRVLDSVLGLPMPLDGTDGSGSHS